MSVSGSVLHFRSQVGEENLERNIFLLANEGGQDEFLESFSNSEGLCLPHLRLIVPHIDKLRIRSHLIETAIKRLEWFRLNLSVWSDTIATDCQSVIEWFLGSRKWITVSGPQGVKMDEALSSESCPVCAFIPKEVSSYMGRLLMTLRHDVTLCEELTRSRGFCNRHGWQAYDIDMGRSNGRTMAMFYFYLLELVTPALRETLRLFSLQSAGKTKWWRLPEWMRQEPKAFSASAPYRGLESSVSCPACRAEADVERRKIWQLVQNLQNPEFRNRYSVSPSLCLPHLRHALRLSNVEGRILLLAKAKERAANLLYLLNKYSRKHSRDFLHEPRLTEEENSAVRAVAFEAGEKFQMEAHLSIAMTEL